MIFLPLILAFSSIIYELGYAYSLSILYPNTQLLYSLVIGIFIFSLGIGTFFYSKQNFKNKENTYLFVETLLILFIPLFLYILFNFEISNNTLIVLYVIIFFTGFLSGMEIPLLTDILNKKFTIILSLDYLGSLLGTVIFSFYLLPKYGIIITLLITTLLNLSTFFSFSKKGKILGLILIIINLYLIQTNLFEQQWNNKWNNIIEEKRLCTDRNCTSKINYIKTTNYQTLVDSNITYNINKKKFNVNCLYLDKEVQYCSNWNDSYHTFLGTIPLKIYNDNENKKPDVLILGGGDSFLYKKIKDKVNSIKVIDIDKFLTNKYFNDNKDVINTDAVNYLLKDKKKYDIIFWDLPMPTNKKLLHLYSNEFFQLIYYSLNKNGYFVHYIPIENDKIFVPFASLIKESKFKYSYFYQATMTQKDYDINKNTPFIYKEYFMISTKKDIKVKYKNIKFDKIDWKKTKFKIDKNSILKPNKKYILNY